MAENGRPKARQLFLSSVRDLVCLFSLPSYLAQKGGGRKRASPIDFHVHPFHLSSIFIKEDHAWQLKQLKDRDTSRAGPSNERVLSPQTSGFPGDNLSLLACSMCWPCSGPPSWGLFSWALIPTPPSSSPESVPSSSSSL